MDSKEFDEIFDQLIVNRLKEHGFDESAKCVYRIGEGVCVSLLRLGGNMRIPGTVAHILCMRHDFLPNINGKVPTGLEKEVFSYPFKIEPKKVARFLASETTYQPQNLQYDYERFDYSSASEQDVVEYLSAVYDGVLAMLDWARKLPIEDAKSLIERPDMAWIEELWVDAYRNAIKEAGPLQQ